MRKKRFYRIINMMVENYEDLVKILNSIYKLIEEKSEGGK